MTEKSKNSDLTEFVNQKYKYGFSTKIESDRIQKGLNEEVIALITKKKNEPEFLLKFRLKAYKKWKKMKHPDGLIYSFQKLIFRMLFIILLQNKKKN